MKIAYLFHLNETNSGVHKKIVSQITAWKANGHNVKAFQVTTTMQTKNEQWNVFQYNPSIKAINSRLKAWDNAIKDIMEWLPDVVYYRYDIYYPSMWSLVRNIPVIAEINTDDTREYCLNSHAKGIYNLLTRGLMLNKVAGMVFVTEDLALTHHFKKFSKKYIVIGNGIDLEEYEQLPPATNSNPRLVFMGSPGQTWHGVDKIIKFAQMLPFWQFDLIGIKQEELGVDTQGNIVCYGYMDRKEYEKILAAADIAIGTMALHRNKMEEATPLKVREYLAFGLPTIIGYKDTDFPFGAPFLLQLPNCESNVTENLESIQIFVKKWSGKRVTRSNVSHIDMQKKERNRLKFMGEAITDG